MAEAVAGAVLGPRPGWAICSFWQGKVEIVLRILAPLVRRYIATPVWHLCGDLH